MSLIEPEKQKGLQVKKLHAFFCARVTHTVLSMHA